MVKRKRKKAVSKKVLAALAKGRAMLKHKRAKSHKRTRRPARRGRRVPLGLEPIIITQGEAKMAKRRKSHKRLARHVSGELLGRKHRKRRAKRSYGFEGRRKRRGRRAYFGGDKGGLVNSIMQGAGVGAGAIGGSMIAGMLPVPAKFKAMVPIALGIGIGMVKPLRKNNIAKAAAMGAIAIGLVSLVRQFVPSLPLLTGDEAYVVAGEIGNEEQAMLGEMIQGEGEDMQGELIQGEEMEGEGYRVD